MRFYLVGHDRCFGSAGCGRGDKIFRLSSLADFDQSGQELTVQRWLLQSDAVKRAPPFDPLSALHNLLTPINEIILIILKTVCNKDISAYLHVIPRRLRQFLPIKKNNFRPHQTIRWSFFAFKDTLSLQPQTSTLTFFSTFPILLFYS